MTGLETTPDSYDPTIVDPDALLSAEEIRSRDLGRRVAPYFARFNPHDRLVEILPITSRTIYDRDWADFIARSKFSRYEKRAVSRAFHWLASYANWQSLDRQYPKGRFQGAETPDLQTPEDAGRFDFQKHKVIGIDRRLALLTREVFRQFVLQEE